MARFVPTTTAYKVVDSVYHSHMVSRVDQMVKSEFCLKYTIGEWVNAPKGSLGIMCFETYEDAVYFGDYWRKDRIKDYKILKVLGIGKPYRPKKIAGHFVPREFYAIAKQRKNKKRMYDTMPAPTGSIIFDSVFVEEEIK